MSTDTRNVFRCTECGWQRKPREYHPLIACWIVKATGRDPKPYLREIAADMAHVDEDGILQPEEARA